MSSWQEQTISDVLFVDWGTLKEGHDAATNIVVKEGKSIEGVVLMIKDHPVFGHIYKIKSKEHEKQILVTGNKALNREMLGEGMKESETKGFTPIKVNDEIRITYNGMYQTESGGKGYDLKVAVKR